MGMAVRKATDIQPCFKQHGTANHMEAIVGHGKHHAQHFTTHPVRG